jgi:hypothetical protein
VTAADLTRAARRLVEGPDPGTRGLWPRAALLVTRQALELALDRLWQRREPGLESCSARAQFLCLGPYLGDAALAREAHAAWQSMSRGCHYRPYELPPTAEELTRWLDVVDAVIARAEAAAGPATISSRK